MDLNIFRYTWRYSKRDQLWLLLVVLFSLPFYFLSLDLPKSIVNGPIQGEGFSSPTDTETAMRIAFDLPTWFFGGGEAVIFNGNLYDRAALDRISGHVERQARSWTVACKILWRFVRNPVFY